VLDNEVPYNYGERWRQWQTERRAELPEPWPPPGERRRASDGAEYELRSRALELLLMLEQAGFADVAVEGDHNGEPATADDAVLVFVGRKGSG
jgi:hypothetical protein